MTERKTRFVALFRVVEGPSEFKYQVIEFNQKWRAINYLRKGFNEVVVVHNGKAVPIKSKLLAIFIAKDMQQVKEIIDEIHKTIAQGIK